VPFGAGQGQQFTDELAPLCLTGALGEDLLELIHDQDETALRGRAAASPLAVQGGRQGGGWLRAGAGEQHQGPVPRFLERELSPADRWDKPGPQQGRFARAGRSQHDQRQARIGLLGQPVDQVRGQSLPAEEPLRVPAPERPQAGIGARGLTAPPARTMCLTRILRGGHPVQQAGDRVQGGPRGTKLAALLRALPDQQPPQVGQVRLHVRQHPAELRHLLAQRGETRGQHAVPVRGQRDLNGVQAAQHGRDVRTHAGASRAGRVQRLLDRPGQFRPDALKRGRAGRAGHSCGLIVRPVTGGTGGGRTATGRTATGRTATRRTAPAHPVGGPGQHVGEIAAAHGPQLVQRRGQLTVRDPAEAVADQRGQERGERRSDQERHQGRRPEAA
jgi:hypothetical protein